MHARACVWERVCVCVCLSRKWFQLRNCWSHHHQTWHGNCLRHANASRVNYSNLDLGHTNRNHHNQCLIISETVQAMPIKCAVKIVWLWPLPVRWPWPSLKVASASQLLLLFNLQYLGQYLSYFIQTWHAGRPIHGIYAHARFDDLDLDARSLWVDKGKDSVLNYFDK